MATEANKLELINSALRMVGSYHLDASDTTSATYEIASRAYAQAVDELFGENIFEFNSKRTSLTGVESTEFGQHKYEYTLPSDYNLFIGVEDADDHPYTDYRFANGKFYCTEQTLKFSYSYVPDLDTNASTLPPFLSRLLSLHMAQNMCIELSGSENRHEILHVQYVKALRRARVLEGRSSPAQTYINADNSQFLNAHSHYGKV